MSITEKGQCIIQQLTTRGVGLSHTPKGPVELPYTLPQETVAFERHRYRHQTNCLLTEIVSSSSHRVSPPCGYFGRCGGCMLQHMDEESQHTFKENLLKQALAKEGIHVTLEPLRSLPSGERRRIRLQVVKKETDIFMGLQRYHSHQIVNLGSCLVIYPALSDLLLPLREILNDILCPHRKAEVWLTQADQGIDIKVVCDQLGTLSHDQRGRLEAFMRGHNVIRWSMDPLTLTHDLPTITLAGYAVAIDPEGFLQASVSADKTLQSLVMESLEGLSPGAPVVDLFCGRGTFALALSHRFRVTGFESNKAACESLSAVATHHSLPLVAHERDLMTAPLGKKALGAYQGCVVNPPRSGMGVQVDHLARSSIRHLCYVSCHPESFAKEARILLDGGYTLTRVSPVDQFPWSVHLEVVGHFTRS